MNEPIDLTNCDREPIHIPGSIQPHGVLVAVDGEMVVTQISQSAEALFGVKPADALGKPIAALLHADDAAEMLARVSRDYLAEQPIYLQRIRGANVGTAFDAIVHKSRQRIIFEFEPSQPDVPADVAEQYRLVQSALMELRAARSMQGLAEAIVRNVRRITRFDRVMLYRFDPEWNGEVLAEDKRPDLEPFLGLHYPASDIPTQARELYTKNWLRFIADRDYVPSPIEPVVDAAIGAPLDLSFSVLRSVSPIHCQYLRNMGVGASMSISLLQDGKLWGLIACHHYSPHRVAFNVRAAGEMLAQVMSLQVSAREQSTVTEDLANAMLTIAKLVERVSPGEVMPTTLVGRDDALLSLMPCGGAAAIFNGKIVRVGQTPNDQDIVQIVAAIRAQSDADVFATDRLDPILASQRLQAVASGVLAIALTRYSSQYVLWFRPELVRTVNWAGDPAKMVVKGEDSRLSPRGSFTLWKETLRGRSAPWSDADKAVAAELRRQLIDRFVANADELIRHNLLLRKTSDEKEQLLESERIARSEAERLNRMKDEFVATLSHELRTPLTAIKGWASLLLAPGRSAEEVAEGLSIINRNAKSQAEMIEDLLDMSRITSGKLRLDVQPVHMPDVVESAIQTVQIAADARGVRMQRFIDPMAGIVVSGDPQRLQQVTWNLLSNAVKFTPRGGTVRVELKCVSSHVELSVSDTGQGISRDFLPHVFDRFRQADASSTRSVGGLGLGLSIVRHVVELHGGAVMADSGGAGKGSTFTVTLPMRAVTMRDAPADHPRKSSSSDFDPDDCQKLSLGEVSVLLVDDEPDTRMLVKRVLEECGVRVTTAQSAAEGMTHLYSGKFDVLISDIGMPREDGYTFITQVREREARQSLPKLPAIALTAYARPEDRRKIMIAGFQMHVAKPVEPPELLAVVASLSGRLG